MVESMNCRVVTLKKSFNVTDDAKNKALRGSQKSKVAHGQASSRPADVRQVRSDLTGVHILQCPKLGVVLGAFSHL
jgi:hypothetical protein